MSNGKIGVTTENIFPIIKKFLYSDHEIFLRELVSNAVDATQKLKTFSSIGEFKGELGDLMIRVSLDKEKKTLTISDSGVGMTSEEVDKYINQIAFSGAEEFMDKYKNQAIIGHFGLGFYSAFMVSDRVEVVTCSYKEGSKTMVWSCDGTPEYTLVESPTQRSRGTDIILYLSEESSEFSESARIEGLLRKYCRFLPIPIYFGKEQQWIDGKNVETDRDKVINNTNPLWTRKPADITKEDYQQFYGELYPMSDDPLFHIHLNIDYPFNLTGILYFPKIRTNFELQKNKIQLYSNQVFVTDSVEGIVPEFLTLMHGVIDSPDIPLNVSRSYLQSDGNVRKISSYITRKVADRLQEIFNGERDEYESKWDDLKVFIQYGIISEAKFADKAQTFMLLKNTQGKYSTLEEYKETIAPNQTDKNGKLVYLYTNDAVSQHSFVAAAQAKGYDVLVMDGQLDNHFVGWFEQKNQDARFVRVDSEIADKLIEKEISLSMSLSTKQQELLSPVFKSHLPVEDKVNYNVVFEPMEATSAPIVITRNEFMRRMKDMSAMGGGGDQMSMIYGQMPDSITVAVNGNHPLVIDVLGDVEKSYGDELGNINKQIEKIAADECNLEELLKGKKEDEVLTQERDMREELSKSRRELVEKRTAKLTQIGQQNRVVMQMVDLALLSNGMLKGEGLTKFIDRSVSMIGK